MRLSSVYLYEKIKEKYEILKKGNLSGNDGYLRPFLRCGINRDDRKKEDRFRSGHVYVIQVRDDEEWERVVPVMKDIFWIFCKKSDSEKQNDNMIVGAGTGIGTGTEVEAGAPESFETDINRNEVEVAVSSCDDSDFGNIPYIQVALENLEEIAEFMNDMQEIFDTADGWERKIHDLMLEHAGMERLLQVTSEFLQNPLTVIGLDFTFVAEAGSKYLPPRARLYTDEGLNVEYVNALLQNETYREMADTHETVMFPAYISGCRSMNRNLFVDEKATHRLILTECRVEITQGVICVLDILSEKLEFLLTHEEEETDPDRDIEQIFVRVLSDRTADYMQISRELSELGWGGNHEYMCLILQITYLNQQNLSTKAISRYIKKKLGDSVSFLYQDEIVVFFDLTRLGMNQEEVAGKLVYFIRDTYLKAGYSRVMTGHMNLRRQYVQAKTALDVGSRKKPYLWIHYFSQVAMTYILEQATKRLPGTMICHEGLLELKKHDEENQTQYMETLRVYLEQHLSATQAARELFIHRSTFLYRLDRIREILQSDLDDPEEIFYLELSFRLLEQEEEKE
ncbi:PucR family transcriptional regulator [Blautia sp. HCN-1074]|uniref:PucR family transcriptional regulator n=1 Tax=Blautia sp. HCN-1074 TaxID=3134667 RepID=UPI001FAA671C